MKRIFLLSCFLTMFISCQKEGNGLEELKSKQLDVDDFFGKVSNMDVNISEDKALLISYKWNVENEKIEMVSYKEVEPSWGLALDVADNLTKRGAPVRETYKVSCDDGGKGWTKSCDGKFSCGSAIYDCLKQGGCATICNANMVYTPKTKTFYLSDDAEKLVDTE